MYIRCKKCHSAVWMPEPSQVRTENERSCRQCGAGYRMGILKSFEKSRDQLADAAREFGQEQGIDLPGAYSILLGVMTVEEVTEIGRGTPVPGPASPPASIERPDPTSRTPDASAGGLAYDDDYRPAVEGGFLTPRQAMERGSRKSQIRRLAQRHDLTDVQAAAVTDNRVSLLAAVRDREKSRETHEKITVRWKEPAPTRPYAVAAVTLVATLLVGGFVQYLWSSQVNLAHQADRAVQVQTGVAQQPDGELTALPVADEGAPPAGTRVTTDRNRLPLEIRGPTAKSVLLAYCTTGAEADRLEPVGLAPTDPTQAGLRYGIVRDWREGDREHAIQIQQDRRTRRWFAGDGARPIVELDPDRLALAEDRVPVYAPKR